MIVPKGQSYPFTSIVLSLLNAVFGISAFPAIIMKAKEVILCDICHKAVGERKCYVCKADLCHGCSYWATLKSEGLIKISYTNYRPSKEEVGVSLCKVCGDNIYISGEDIKYLVRTDKKDEDDRWIWKKDEGKVKLVKQIITLIREWKVARKV